MIKIEIVVGIKNFDSVNVISKINRNISSYRFSCKFIFLGIQFEKQKIVPRTKYSICWQWLTRRILITVLINYFTDVWLIFYSVRNLINGIPWISLGQPQTWKIKFNDNCSKEIANKIYSRNPCVENWISNNYLSKVRCSEVIEKNFYPKETDRIDSEQVTVR